MHHAGRLSAWFDKRDGNRLLLAFGVSLLAASSWCFGVFPTSRVDF